MEVSWGSYKPRNANRIPKLSLDKGEQARICVLEESPRQVFVHTFQKVVTDDRGKPIEIHDTWPDGSPNVRYQSEYAGKYRCLGDPEVVNSAGADPANCPACRGHIENPSAIKAAQARFLVKILKYNTKPGSFAPTKPFAASLIAWDLTSRRFEELQALYEEHGDLRNKDLLLGPCEDKTYQKFSILIGSDKAIWQQNTDYIKELISDNPLDDIESVAGKKPTEEELQVRTQEIVRAYNHAMNITSTSSSYESLISKEEPAPKVTRPAKSSPVEEVVASPVVAEEVIDTDGADEAEDDEGTEEDATASLSDLLKQLGG